MSLDGSGRETAFWFTVPVALASGAPAPMSRAIQFLLLGTLALSCRGRVTPAFVELAEARRLAGEMRVDFAKASDASDRAVLADTDADSQKFAREAELHADAVQADAAQLAARLSDLGNRADADLLSAFQERFTRYRTLDRAILVLAVENTNLKAQRLSFGPVRQAADQLSAALDAAVAAVPVAGRCRADTVAARAKLAVREIQILQAPHIAESQDAEMDRLEKQMAERKSAAHSALESLASTAPAAARAALDRAKAGLDDFDRLSGQLIALSRANSNVRSLELTLRQKPALTASCDESLAALDAALAKRAFGATR